MSPSVKHPDEAQEYYFEEGCYILELSNSEDDPELSIARARVIPGVSTKLHLLKDTIERYVILQGKGRVELGSQIAKEVAVGDVVLIPPACPQKITNTSATDLIFLVVCTPRFTPQAYVPVAEN